MGTIVDTSKTAVLRRRWGHPDRFTSMLTHAVGRSLQQLDKHIRPRMLLTVKHKQELNLQWFNRNDRTKQALANGNHGLWGDMTGMFRTAKRAGCDLAIGLFYHDVAFDISEVAGVANLFQICDDLAYGVVKLYPTDPPRQVAITAHEIGHILGVDHDHMLDEFYTRPMMRSLLSKQVAALRKWCIEDPNSGCEDKVVGRCIMHESPVGGRRMPTRFSK